MIEDSWMFRVSMSIIRSALAVFEKPLVCFSGGKDSTLMVYMVSKALEEVEKEGVTFLIGDPFPIKGNVEFCLKTLDRLGLGKDVYPRVLYKDYVGDECMRSYVEKSGNMIACCYWCKIKVLQRVVKRLGVDAVLVAVRWDEHPARSEDDYFRRIYRPEHFRVEPILHWRWDDVLKFYREHPDLLNPLYLQGYTSLGCKPCTAPTLKRAFRNADEYLDYLQEKMRKGEVRERAGRRQDKERGMERLRALGYLSLIHI